MLFKQCYFNTSIKIFDFKVRFNFYLKALCTSVINRELRHLHVLSVYL